MKHIPFSELGLPETPEVRRMVNRWLVRGDGIAVYENQDMGHPELGTRKFVSFGSNEAQIESNIPPERLPDIGSEINWRYILVGVYQGGPVEEHKVTFGTLNPDGSVSNQRLIKQSDIQQCPFVILVPDHYREDGSCRCNDETHTEMAEWGYTWDPEQGKWAA